MTQWTRSPVTPAPSLPLSPPCAGVTAAKPAGTVTGVGHGGWDTGGPNAGPAGRQKVMQPFCKAAALGTAALIGANEERGWLLLYMAAAGNSDAYARFSLKVLGITLDI